MIHFEEARNLVTLEKHQGTAILDHSSIDIFREKSIGGAEVGSLEHSPS